MMQQEITTALIEDLKHIPDGPDLDIQNELRVLYNSHRRKDLAAGKPRKETMQYCITMVKYSYPCWRPNIDAEFFDLE